MDYIVHGWAPKNSWFWTVVLEKTLESTLDCKEIKPVNPKVNQSWIFFGRTDAEAPILRVPDANSQLTGKEHDAGKDWGKEENVATEDEMVWNASLTQWRWIWQAPGDGEQGSLACCIQFMESQSQTRLSDWTTKTTSQVSYLTCQYSSFFIFKIEKNHHIILQADCED